jgi:hypothetical protein
MDFIEFKKRMKEEWENSKVEYKEKTLVELKKICKGRNIKVKGRPLKEKIIELLNK